MKTKVLSLFVVWLSAHLLYHIGTIGLENGAGKAGTAFAFIDRSCPLAVVSYAHQ